MEFLGVGPAELVVIFVLMFVFAGPKRMAAWAYQLGTYVRKVRAMFDETMSAVKKEFEAAQIDLPADVNQLRKQATDMANFGKFNVVKEATKVVNEAFVGSSVSNAASSNASQTPSNSSNNGPESSGSSDNSASSTSSDTNSDSEKSRYDSWLPKPN